MDIILVTISGYLLVNIGEYWCLLMDIILVTISGYLLVNIGVYYWMLY
jgi:hypothetical protein